MAYIPVSGVVPQFSTLNNELADGYYLKFYEANDIVSLSMATDGTGMTLLSECKLNPNGYPISNPADNTTVFIPHLSASYRAVLYTNKTDADNDATENAVWNVADISIVGANSVQSVASIPDLPPATGSGNKVNVTSFYDGWAVIGDGLPKGGGVMVDSPELVVHNGATAYDPLRSGEIGTAAYYNTEPAINCWVRDATDVFNIYQSGARTDLTSTVNNPAVANLLAYIDSAGGGQMRIPAGDWDLNIVDTYDKVSIVGDGRGSVLKPTTGTALTVSGVTGGFGSWIGNLAIDGSAGATLGLSVSGFSRGTFGDFWITDIDSGLYINGDASTEIKFGDIYITNPAVVGLDYQRTDGVDTGGLYFNKFHVTGGVTSGIGARFQSSHTSRTRAFAFFNQLVIDNRFTEAMLVENINSIFVSQCWLTGNIAGKGMLSMRDVKDIHMAQIWCQNSNAGGYNILFSGGGASDPADDVNLEQLRTSGPGTSIQFNGSPTLTRCKIGNWNDTATTKTNDVGRLKRLRSETFEGDVTVEGTFNLGGGVPTLTISSGTVTLPTVGASNKTSFYRIAPETGTADTLATISGGVEGDVLLLMSNSSANTITFEHGTGNIYLDGSVNFVANSSRDKLELILFNSEWQEVSHSNNS